MVCEARGQFQSGVEPGRILYHVGVEIAFLEVSVVRVAQGQGLDRNRPDCIRYCFAVVYTAQGQGSDRNRPDCIPYCLCKLTKVYKSILVRTFARDSFG